MYRLFVCLYVCMFWRWEAGWKLNSKCLQFHVTISIGDHYVSWSVTNNMFSLVKKYQEFQELKNQHLVEVMSRCHVIGMTVTGAAMRANLLGEW